MRVSLTAVFEPVEDGWTQARIAELPAVVTTAPSPHEARELLVDALREYLLSLGADDPHAEIAEAGHRARLDVVLDA